MRNFVCGGLGRWPKRTKIDKKKIILHGIWEAQNDRTATVSIFGYHDDAPKCLIFYIFGGLWSKRPECKEIPRSQQQVV